MLRVARVAVAFNLFDTTARAILSGVSAFARRTGALEIIKVLDNQLTETAWRRLPAGLRGVVAHIPDALTAELAMRAGIPVVNTSNMLPSPDLASVTHDDRAVGAMAADHFMARGFTSFMFVGHAEAMFSRERWQGFSAALAAQGLASNAVNVPLPTRDAWAPEPAAPALAEAVARAHKPLAIFAVTDRVGRMLVETGHALGAAVPDDIAVVGVNDDPFEVAACGVVLSSIRLAGEALGARAALILTGLLSGQSRPLIRERVAPAALITRTSTETHATADPRLRRALRHLREHVHDVRGVDELAHVAGMSRRAFELEFKRSRGWTPGEHMRAFRVERAKTLLLTSSLSPPDIASRIGVEGVRVFNRLFKEATGFTPCDFRQRVGGAQRASPARAESSHQR